jgi:deoxyribodipyrimidine photo-lyase
VSAPTLVWFRLDLRLADNPALAAAAARGPVVPVFVWSPEEEGAAAPGAASRVWLHQSLLALEAALHAKGSPLIIRRGPTAATLLALAREVGASGLHYNRRYEPPIVARDRAVEHALRAAGVHSERFGSALLFEPEAIKSSTGGAFQVFSPFWRACLNGPAPAPPAPAPVRLQPPARHANSLDLEELGLLPGIDWTKGIRARFRPGEAGAQQRLAAFLRGPIDGYAADRDQPLPDGEAHGDGTSLLSPHLHHGEIGPRQIWHAVRDRTNARGGEPSVFLRELGWREFAHHLLVHFPTTVDKPLRQSFAQFPWGMADDTIKAWQHGRTGYPFVDAGMRELWATGFMHNRVRMVVASFLTKHLLHPWQVGARWFWDTLVDADLANNTLGWQWVAGCGADAAPFFRIFHPVSQGRKFDPKGHYVRRWVPEIFYLPDRYIHAPWEAPEDLRRDAGVKLGATYPAPIVDHMWARQRALSAYASMQEAAGRDRTAFASQ